MTPREILNRAQAGGLQVEIAGDRLRITGGDDLPDETFQALTGLLAEHKLEVLAHLREQSYLALEELTRQGRLRWTEYPEGAFMPDHPTPPKQRYDVLQVEDLRYQAHPLPYERKQELLRLQEKAENAKFKRRDWQTQPVSGVAGDDSWLQNTKTHETERK